MSAVIRMACPDDAKALLRIYAPYVEHTAITFEYTVPSEEEFRGRIAHTLERYPYLVMEEDGIPVGYCYASAFHSRAAYNHCSELSIYLDSAVHGKGYGRLLYEEMEARLKKMGVLNLYACIAVPETDDEYLTHNSPEFHAHLGFSENGFFTNCGYKFGRWYHMIWMEKLLGDHTDRPAPFVPYPALSE